MYGHLDDCMCTMCVGARAQGIENLPPPPVAETPTPHDWSPGRSAGDVMAACVVCGFMPFEIWHTNRVATVDAQSTTLLNEIDTATAQRPLAGVGETAATELSKRGMDLTVEQIEKARDAAQAAIGDMARSMIINATKKPKT